MDEAGEVILAAVEVFTLGNFTVAMRRAELEGTALAEVSVDGAVAGGTGALTATEADTLGGALAFTALTDGTGACFARPGTTIAATTPAATTPAAINAIITLRRVFGGVSFVVAERVATPYFIIDAESAGSTACVAPIGLTGSPVRTRIRCESLASAGGSDVLEIRGATGSLNERTDTSE